MNYKQLYKQESFGGELSFGIDIQVDAPVDLTSYAMRKASRQAAQIIQDAITREFYKNDKKAQELAFKQKL